MSNQRSIRDLHLQNFEDLNALWAQLDDLEEGIQALSQDTMAFTADPVERTLEKIRAFEPSVGIIGQVKAGKSTLLNAMIGQVDLLPSDVNPWTSVITGVHVNSRKRPRDTRALFRFFDAEEWDRLVETGGRLGEMAMRAGFETEVAEVRHQVTRMRQTTETRLGDQFERLLGNSHAYNAFDKETIDRYICYGDPEDLADGSTEGVYADITKSADLYLDLPGFPSGLCLRDTPGVNDTFMMREQITLNAISESRVCVVVLSAHQALSTMDLALLRIICSVQAREVLLFVNRIDELAEPVAELGRIRSSIEGTLAKMGLGKEVEIMFGSGYWANCAISDTCARMKPASRAALKEVCASEGLEIDDPESFRMAAMEASGVGELLRAIAQRVIEGPGQALLKDIESDLETIAHMSETVMTMVERNGRIGSDVERAEIEARLDSIAQEALYKLDSEAAAVRAHLEDRLVKAQQTFVANALEALQSHINAFGEADTWSHDPMSLRMTMRSAFNSACGKLRRLGEIALEEVLDGSHDVLEYEMGLYQDGGSVDFPEQVQPKSPTILARTMTLDLQGAWWRKFWRFGRKNAAETRYRSMIEAETTPLINELMCDYFDPVVAKTREVVELFASDQRKFVTAVFDCAEENSAVGEVSERAPRYAGSVG